MVKISSVAKRPGNTRKTGKEQFYTPTVLAEFLVDEAGQHIAQFDKRLFLEPAGGTGAFVKALQKRQLPVISFDIEPHHKSVETGSFLEQTDIGERLVTISNPPFGRNNSLSIPFFNHAAKYSDYICFIVPRSWRKWSVINRLDRNFKLLYDRDLQIDYVDRFGEPLSSKLLLNTCFQIWKRTDQQRPLVQVTDRDLIEKTDAGSADVAMSVFGYRCGQVETDFVREANSTKIYLKLKHPRALEALTQVDYSKFYRNTAYTEALSFMEINYLLNEFIFGDPQLEEIA